MQNGSQARDITGATGASPRRFGAEASLVAGSPAADFTKISPQSLQPKYYQNTRTGHPQPSVSGGRNAISGNDHVRHLSSQDYTHQLRNPPIKEDEAHSSIPRWNKPAETTALLGQRTISTRAATVEQRSDHVAEDKSETTRKHELLLLVKNSFPLIITSLLQYTLTGASVLVVGHIGKNELGAVSLALMTSNLTGYVIYEGLSTGLDTLCAQAYGSGKLHLVGLHLQRMIYFLWLVTIPIAAVWLSGTQLLLLVIPEQECARLAGLYLKVLLLGTPGFAAFEAGKRFVQAQGLFFANLYVLLFCAPLNAFMSWLFVWRFNWGFIGAPIAVAITHNLLAFCLFLYVYFVNGSQCWPGLSKQALKNWGPMIKLGFSGFMMVVAEFLAFEILTLASSYLSNTTLAAQAALASLSMVTFQIPFPISVAGSTRLANLIGAGLAGASKKCIQVTLMMAFAAGLLNMILLTTLRDYIPKLFTEDLDVQAAIFSVLPIFAGFQLFDAGVASVNGIMRGMGQQSVGSYVNMCCYYLIAIPVSLGFAFGLGWGLFGLWMGPPMGLLLVTTINGWLIYHTNWDRIIEAASCRNEMA